MKEIAPKSVLLFSLSTFILLLNRIAHSVRMSDTQSAEN
jgi:hypothetical protein